jgi:hypothetical protein
MTALATFHYMRDDQFVFAGQLPTNCETAREFADALAGITDPSYCDSVQVWLGAGIGERLADLPHATAEVAR